MQRADTDVYCRDHLFTTGNKFFAEKKYEKAVECYNAIPKINVTPTVYYNRAKALCHLGKYDEAISNVLNASGLANSVEDFLLAEIYLQKKDYRQAIEHYNLYIHSDAITEPDCVLSTYQGLAKAYGAQQDYINAITYYSKYLQYDCLNTSIYLDKGLAHVQLKEYDKAIVDFNQALKIDPNLSEVHFYLGKIYDEMNKPAEALYEYCKTLSSNNSTMVLNQTCFNNINISQWQTLPKHKEIFLLNLACDETSLLGKKLLDIKSEIQSRLEMLQETVVIKQIKAVTPEEVATDTVENPSRLDYLIDEALFDTISAYRLKLIELQFLSKKFPLLVVSKVDANIEVNQFIDDHTNDFYRVSPDKIEIAYDQVIESSKLTNPHTIVDKINSYLSLIWIFNNLKTKKWILETDLGLLKEISLYKELHKELLEKCDGLTSISTTLPYTDLIHQPTSMATLESEFVKQAKQKIAACNDRFQLAQTLKRIGWLRENIREEAFFYDNNIYRGDLTNISFKFLRDSKNSLNTYTAQMGIRDKVKLLLENSKEYKDDLTEKKQMIYDEYAAAKEALAVAQKTFESKRDAFFKSKNDIKKEKKERSSVPVFISEFRH